MKVVAMYLPQFHEVKENNEWWGEGFTEWQAVQQAEPLFEKHRQPKVPLNNYYYDLSQKETMEWQASLMEQYGVDGLCFYHYWFKDGRKILEKPAENLLEWKDINMPFCFSWANESWIRTWSKLSKKSNAWSSKFEDRGRMQGDGVLLLQDYGEEEQWKTHFDYLLPFFKDKRYMKIDNKPIFMLYKPDEIYCLKELSKKWNEWAREAGFEGIYFIGANCSEESCEYISANYYHEPIHMMDKLLYDINTQKKPIKLEYGTLWKLILDTDVQNGKTCFGGFVGYDDTPRHGERGRVVLERNREEFKHYLTELLGKNEAYENEITFINAWNEWGEGMYLEPDTEKGYAYLEAVSYAKQHYKEYVSYYKMKKELNINSGLETLEKLKENLRKYSVRTRIFDKWLLINGNEISISKYFEDKGINAVAIYGMGRLGRHLLSDLKKNNISVEYVIDKRANIKNIDLPIYDMESVPVSVDTVIVALDSEYEKVIWSLEKKGFKNVLLIENVIEEIRKNEIK